MKMTSLLWYMSENRAALVDEGDLILRISVHIVEM